MLFTLTPRGCSIPTAALTKLLGGWAKYQALCKSLTVIQPQKIGAPKVRRAVKYVAAVPDESPAISYLPRAFVDRLCGALRTATQSNNPQGPAPGAMRPLGAKLPTPSLYPSHEIVVDHVLREVFGGGVHGGTASFEMRAGTGKTFVAAGLIAALGQRTLYVVPKRPLMNQAAGDFTRAFSDDDDAPRTGVSPPKIAQWDEGEAAAAAADIVVIVINSALLRDDAFFAGFGLVIFDEVHEYCTDVRQEIFWRTAAVPCLFGMTATPDKAFNELFRFHLGAPIHALAIPGFEYPATGFHGVARIIRWYGHDDYSHNLTHEKTGKIFTHYMHNQAVQDEARMRLAVSELIALYDWRGDGWQKHHIYVFAEQLSILRQCREMLCAELAARRRDDIVADIDVPEEAAAAIDESQMPMFTGGLKRAELDSVAAHGRVLFTTYGYGGTGISYTKMTAMLFFTTRRANMIQILGRILRAGSDATIPRVVVDIVDTRTALRGQLNDRLAAYDLYEFKRQWLRARYDDAVAESDDEVE